MARTAKFHFMAFSKRIIGGLVASILGLALGVAHALPNDSTTPPALRLGSTVVPLAYDAQLAIQPGQERFTGHIVIDLDLAIATQLVWINAYRLDIKKAVLSASGRNFTARVVTGNRDSLGLRFGQVIAAGHAQLTIEYEGFLDSVNPLGAFRAREGSDWYVMTRFVPNGARRVFPCFDDPQWHTPWKLTLDVPSGNQVVGSTAISTEEALPAGMKRVHLAATPAWQSAQLYFAVGPFDVVSGPAIGHKGVPFHVLVPKGQADSAHFALVAAPHILDHLEDYLGQTYPFDRLDLVAFPVLGVDVATNTPAVMQVASTILLARPQDEGEIFREHFVRKVAQGLAHQWFGASSSIAWWDDAWFDDMLAQWLSERAAERYRPAWQTRLRRDVDRLTGLLYDVLPSALPTQHAVDSGDTVADAFDPNVAARGSAVLRMIENWIGEDRLRNSVRRYLSDHAGAVGRPQDFATSLSREAGSEYATAVSSYTSLVARAGAPSLEIMLDCGSDRLGHPSLEIVQTRFSPLRSLADAEKPPEESVWPLPACFQYGEGADFAETCQTLRQSHTTLSLPDGERCPDWVVGNRGGTGYFVANLKGELREHLSHAPLLPDEAVAVLGTTRVLAWSGQLPADQALAMAARFSNNRQAPVVEAALDVVSTMPHALLASDADRSAFNRYVRNNFGPRASLLGWLAHPGEREVEALLRAHLLLFVADEGDDVALRGDATRLAHDWLGGKAELGEMTSAILQAAAVDGNRELFDTYLAALDHATDNDRQALLQALTAFRNGKLLDEALALTLSDRLDAHDTLVLLDAAAMRRRSARQTLMYVRTHYDALVKHSGDEFVLRSADYTGQICDATDRRDANSFFAERVAQTAGAMPRLSRGLERADLCIAVRNADLGRLSAYLGKHD